MSKFTTALNSFASGTASVAAAMEKVENQRSGAYSHMMNAATIWVDEHGTGEDSAKDFRAAVKVQQDTVWAKNSTRYGRILKTETDDDGVVTVKGLSQSAMNAISVTKGAIRHGIDCNPENESVTFPSVKKLVAAANAAENGTNIDSAVTEALSRIGDDLTAIRKESKALDDMADLGPIETAVAAVLASVRATLLVNAEREAEGNKTGESMSEADKTALRTAAKSKRKSRKTAKPAAKAA